MKKFYFLLLFILIAIDTQGFNLRNLNKASGLTNSSVLSIAQDNNGYMLVGTCDRLNIYNGVAMYPLDLNIEQLLIEGHLVFSSIQLVDGRYCIQTNYSLNILDHKKRLITSVEEFRADSKLKQNDKLSLYFISEKGRLVTMSADNTFSQTDIEGVDFHRVVDYYIDSIDRLWIFESGKVPSLYQIEEAEGKVVSLTKIEQDVIDSKVMAASMDSESILYIDENSDLRVVWCSEDGDTFIYNLRSEIEQKGSVSSLAVHNDNYLIGYERSGLSVIVPDGTSRRLVETEIRSGIFSISHDNNREMLWIGTDGQGVYIYSEEHYSIRSFQSRNFAPEISNPIRALYLDEASTLWIGTKGDGMIKVENYDRLGDIDLEDVSRITTANSNLSDNSVFSISRSSRHSNIVWIGTANGLDYLDLSSGEIYRTNLPVGQIYSIYEDSDGTLWMASVGNGIFRVRVDQQDGKISTKIEAKMVLDGGEVSANYFFKVAPYREGELLVANRGMGGYVINTHLNRIIRKVGQRSSVYNRSIDDVFSITSNSDSYIWMATGCAMAEVDNRDSLKIFKGSSEALYGHSIQEILIDNYGYIWATTCNGLVRYDHRSGETLTLDNRSGLDVTEFSNGACFIDHSTGTLLFGGINGFVSIGVESSAIVEPELDGILRLSAVNVGSSWYYSEELLSDDNTLTVSYDQDVLALSFALLDHRAITDYIFEYRLSGSEPWTVSTTGSVLNFINMTSGTYDMQVRVIDRSTGYISEPYSLTMVIDPPWWGSRIAYILYALIMASLILLLVLYILRRNRLREIERLRAISSDHQQQVYESKIRIFNNIAEEFTTPLTIISTPCRNLLEYGGESKFIVENTNLIKENCDKMKDLINDFFSFKESQLSTSDLAVDAIDLSSVVLSQLATYSDLAKEKSLSLNPDVQPKLMLGSDSAVVCSLLSNLFNFILREANINSAVAVTTQSSGDASVIITGRYRSKQGSYDRLGDLLKSFENSNNFLNKEQGIQLKNQLSIHSVHNLINRLGGTMEIESTDGQLSIIIEIPSHIVEAGADAEQSLPSFSEKKRVLIADDNSEMLEYYCAILEGDYTIISTTNPLEVEDIILEQSVDLILMSTKIIALDDFIMIRKIRENPLTINVPIVVISNKPDASEKTKAIEAGVQMHLTKPFGDDYLLSAVRNNIDRSENLQAFMNSPIASIERVKGMAIHKDNVRFMVKVTEIIGNNIQNNELCADYIATELNISTRQLYRKVKEANSLGLKALILQVRMEYAVKQLTGTLLTVDEIINSAGFTSRASFYKAFQQHYGMSPGAYRKAYGSAM